MITLRPFTPCRTLRVLPELLTLTAVACSASVLAQAPATPAAVIKWSMGKYAQMPSFSADCTWNVAYPGTPGNTAQRTLQYAKPNRFKMVSTMSKGMFTQYSVSDGKSQVEYAKGAMTMPAQKFAAPPSLADAHTMYLQHPMFCGTLLYNFFGGAAKYPALVNEAKMPLAFGRDVTLDGEPCKTVIFWAQGQYGKTEVAIGAKDGLVHRIRYDSQPLMEQTRKMMQSPQFQQQMQKMNKSGKGMGDMAKMMPTTSDTTETYSHLAVGKPIAPATFAATVPAGLKTLDMAAMMKQQARATLPIGKPAPNFTVVGMNGAKTRLSDYRGKVVLLDFWATWCPPCRKGLPETQKFHADYGQKGLAVLAISAENKPIVQNFLTQNKYTFPTYLDAGSVANKSYGITGIPTTVVIDRAGNVVAFMVGLNPRENILAALKKAGLKI